VHVDSVADVSEVLTASIFRIEMGMMGEKLHVHGHSHILPTSTLRVQVLRISETSVILLTYIIQKDQRLQLISVMTHCESLK
jgi:hypothetical protein